MPSVLAIISKAIFEDLAPRAEIGQTLPIDRYHSKHVVLDKALSRRDALYLVTVRPDDERLWLVAIVEQPVHRAGTWSGKLNTTPITDVTPVLGELELVSGKGLTATKGALAMSLQTPRTLTAEDEQRLRSRVPKQAPKPVHGRSRAGEAYAQALASTPKMKAAGAANAKLAKKKSGPGLRLDNYRRPLEAIGELKASEKRQLLSLVQGDGFQTLEQAAANEHWHPMELMDVVDEASGEIRYQLYLYPYGSGALFVNGTLKNPANVCQHSLDFEKEDRALREALAIAYHRDRKRLKIQEVIEFGLDDV